MFQFNSIGKAYLSEINLRSQMMVEISPILKSPYWLIIAFMTSVCMLEGFAAVRMTSISTLTPGKNWTNRQIFPTCHAVDLPTAAYRLLHRKINPLPLEFTNACASKFLFEIHMAAFLSSVNIDRLIAYSWLHNTAIQRDSFNNPWNAAFSKHLLILPSPKKMHLKEMSYVTIHRWILKNHHIGISSNKYLVSIVINWSLQNETSSFLSGITYSSLESCLFFVLHVLSLFRW